MSPTPSLCLPVVEPPVASASSAADPAGCCRATVVPLTGRDIFRIVTELKIPFWRFVGRWNDQSGAISRGIAPHFFFDDSPQTPFVIGLLQAESVSFPSTRKCCFLDETPPGGDAPFGPGRCTIYDHRPISCRIYPSRIDEIQLFSTVARRWNDEPGPWPLFPNFLELVYRALAG